MKHLAFLHSVVRKRRTFGNIVITDESNFPMEIQDCDSYKDNTENLSEENKNSAQYINYEYLDDETGISKIGISCYFYVSNMNDYKLMI